MAHPTELQYCSRLDTASWKVSLLWLGVDWGGATTVGSTFISTEPFVQCGRFG